MSLGSIASALGKWSALNGEDECLPSFATTWALSLFGQHAGRPKDLLDRLLDSLVVDVAEDLGVEDRD